MARNPVPRITPDEARQGLYIDFEGPREPALCGLLEYDQSIDDITYAHLLLDEALFPAADWTKGVFRSSMAEVAERIIAARDDPEGPRMVFAWSEREEKALRAAGDAPLYSQAADSIVNARRIAKRWKNLHHREVEFEKHPKKGRHRLINYLSLIGYEVPADAGEGISADAVREMGGVLRQGEQPDGDVSRAWSRCLITTSTTVRACAPSFSRSQAVSRSNTHRPQSIDETLRPDS